MFDLAKKDFYKIVIFLITASLAACGCLGISGTGYLMNNGAILSVILLAIALHENIQIHYLGALGLPVSSIVDIILVVLTAVYTSWASAQFSFWFGLM